MLVLETAVQHGTAGDDDGGDVATGRAHQKRRRGLVAAAQEDDSVNRIAANGFLNVHAGQIAEEHGSGAKIGLAEGHDGKFERQAAGFRHALLDAVRDLAEVCVARGELRPGIADSDDWAAVEDVGR